MTLLYVYMFLRIFNILIKVFKQNLAIRHHTDSPIHTRCIYSMGNHLALTINSSLFLSAMLQFGAVATGFQHRNRNEMRQLESTLKVSCSAIYSE